MVAIRSVDTISAKFVKNAVAATPDYEAGVRAPLRDYAADAKAAEPSFNAGVQGAIARGAFGKGITKAGTAKWQDKSIKKGTVRYGPGVQDSQPDYSSGFGPYQQVISRITLPAKGAKGNPGNLARVSAIANALRGQKTGTGTPGGP